MATKTLVTIDEYLLLPETKPASELVAGEIVQKPMPTLKHALLANELAHALTQHLRTGALGIVAPELRYLDRGSGRAYLPDVSVLRADRIPAAALAGAPVEVHPDLAIEVLSPDDRAGDVLEQVGFYLRIGVPLVWVVDPEAETLTAFRPSETLTVHRAPQVVDARPVLPDFRLDTTALFAVTRLAP